MAEFEPKTIRAQVTCCPTYVGGERLLLDLEGESEVIEINTRNITTHTRAGQEKLSGGGGAGHPVPSSLVPYLRRG